MKRTAQQEADAIRARVDAYYRDEITHEEFTAQQIAHWKRIRERSERFNDKVCALVAGGLRDLGQPRDVKTAQVDQGPARGGSAPRQRRES